MKPQRSALTRRQTFAEAATKYFSPHYARANTTLRPQDIDINQTGHHSSLCFEHGVRTYIFEGQKNRDRFVNLYRPHSAQACGDPLKGKKDHAQD